MFKYLVTFALKCKIFSNGEEMLLEKVCYKLHRCNEKFHGNLIFFLFSLLGTQKPVIRRNVVVFVQKITIQCL